MSGLVLVHELFTIIAATAYLTIDEDERRM
jgi:hypothetical protein